MRLLVVMVLLLLKMYSGGPTTAALIEGQVVDASNDQPLAGVSIEIEASGRSKLLTQTTSVTGRFSINPTEHFTANDLDTYALMLTFSREGYRCRNRLLGADRRGDFRRKKITVKLENLSSSLQIDQQVLQALRRNKCRKGTTLYVVPYMLATESTAMDAENINRILKFHLNRGIKTHLQSLETDTATPKVGISEMPVEIETENTEKVRTYGRELNALAVVGGMGFDSAEGDAVDVVSEYVIIPEVSKFTLPSILFDDKFTLKELKSSRMFERLHKLWGPYTVLALSLVEVKKALKSGDNTGFERALDYLNAEKKQVGPHNGALVKYIDALMAIVKEELQQ